jgi:hypothetical protein
MRVVAGAGTLNIFIHGIGVMGGAEELHLGQKHTSVEGISFKGCGM